MMTTPTLDLTARQKKWVLVAVLLAVLVVAVVMGAVLRNVSVKKADDEYRTMRRVITEKFNAAPEDFTRHPKNDVYNEFIKHYYSSGRATPTIMFMPSVTDVACSNFQQDIQTDIICGRNEGAAPLDDLSIRDTRASLGYHRYEVCGSREVATGPLDPQDAHVRVLNGMYSLRKTCVQVPYLTLGRASGASNADDVNPDELEMSIPTEDPATLFVMLTRPVFLVANRSYIYHVRFPPGGGYKYGYREPGEQYATLRLSRVAEPMMYKVGSEAQRHNLLDLYRGSQGDEQEPLFLPATLYYLNYEHPVRRGLSEVQFDEYNTLTMVFPVSKKRLESQLTWFSTQRISVMYDNETSKVRVDVPGSSTESLEVGKHGYVVVVYAFDTVLVCYMGRGKVTLVRNNVSTQLAMSSSQTEGVRDQVIQAGALPPSTCYPCNLFSVPNLYDMYTKLVAFA